jgi:hypothetical protein
MGGTALVDPAVLDIGLCGFLSRQGYTVSGASRATSWPRHPITTQIMQRNGENKYIRRGPIPTLIHSSQSTHSLYQTYLYLLHC